MRVSKKTWFNSLLILSITLGMACGDDKTSDNNVSVSFAGDIPPLLTKGKKIRFACYNRHGQNSYQIHQIRRFGA